MGAVLSSPGLSRVEVKNVVEESIAPVRNSSENIDSKLNTVVEKITDQILNLKEYIAKEKMKNVASLENAIRKASTSSDPAAFDQIRELEEALGQARAEAEAVQANMNSVRKEKNILAQQKMKSNANLREARKAANNAARAVQNEKNASVRAINAAKAAAEAERKAYTASNSAEKEELQRKADQLKRNAEQAKANVEAFRQEKETALRAKQEADEALAAEKTAKEAALEAERLAKEAQAQMATASADERAALQAQVNAARRNANAKAAEAQQARANAQAARQETNATKLELQSAQQAKANADQAVAIAKAAAEKAKQNANAAVGEEKQKLKLIAEKALRNLQNARAEAVTMATKLANAQAQTGQLEANLLRAATEKTQEVERRVAAETKLNQYNKQFPALQSPVRSTRLNIAQMPTRTQSKTGWNPSTKIRGGKRKTHARHSHGKHRFTRKHY